jgi:hypothetical protein
VFFIVHKTIMELERAILTTLFLSVQKTPTKCFSPPCEDCGTLKGKLFYMLPKRTSS